MVDVFIWVAKIDQDDGATQLPLENDGTLTLSTIRSYFPNAIGLKYISESGVWRAVRYTRNFFHSPKLGWGTGRYYIAEIKKSLKRKIKGGPDVTASKLRIREKRRVCDPLPSTRECTTPVVGGRRVEVRLKKDLPKKILT